MNKIIVIKGPQNSGKTTILKNFVNLFEEVDVKYLSKGDIYAKFVYRNKRVVVITPGDPSLDQKEYYKCEDTINADFLICAIRKNKREVKQSNELLKFFPNPYMVSIDIFENKPIPNEMVKFDVSMSNLIKGILDSWIDNSF